MTVNLGLARIIGADAVGEPGQRRFRLYVQSTLDSAIMWMEKEQLRNLSQALDRFIAHLGEGQILRTEARPGGLPAAEKIPGDFPTRPTYDFQVGQMKLNYDEARNLILLSAIPLEIVMERNGEPQVLMREEDAVSLLFTQEQAQQLSNAILSVVSSGRPVCPLCHTPLDGGPHACVKQNGHRQIIQVQEQEIEEDEDDEE